MKTIYILLLLILSSCVHKSKDTTSFEQPKLQEFDLTNVDGGQAKKVTLLPHQKHTIEYLLTHKDQKGLLINHGLGTGKTFLALGYCEQIQEKQVYILVPQSLKSNWVIQMQEFGVKSKERYHLISFDEASTQLENHQFENDIVIIDEAHRFVDLVRFGGQNDFGKYARFYLQLQKSYKILLLTGTPIYTQASDLAYHFNLVAGKEVLPFNQEKFRNQYTSVDYDRSFWRGHLTESSTLKMILPFIGTFALLATNPAAGGLVFAGLLGFSVALPFVNANYTVGPQGEHPLRYFNVNKLTDLSKKYVSFYEVSSKNDLSQFPKSKEISKEVDYSRPQISYYLDFLDKRLDESQLNTLLDEENYKQYRTNTLFIQSTSIQEELIKKPGAGREIGNLTLNEKEPPKFERLRKVIATAKGPVVIYSNYFENGILKLSVYLNKNGMKHEILNPFDAVDAQVKTLRAYNKGQVPILLLHPGFTEGISLHGTAQLHILEPIFVSQLFKQIKGRVIRYKSHAHLEESLRKVDLYVWRSSISYWTNLNHRMAVKENWQKYFSELNDYSGWGSGLVQVDPQAVYKKTSPDSMVQLRVNDLDRTIDELRDLFKSHNIETNK